MVFNYDELLRQYRSLWNNRVLQVEKDSKNTLLDAIRRELDDANSHPRIRKGLHEKFYFAIKRINRSSLCEDIKTQLIALHIKVMEEHEGQ
ncbi:hypothetical protein J27TS8_08940 [Robertmurraya siralis]|uniref:Uncharacterized protein n=1 Tax=Robertmurraya siralis TaxID=77777 RepID=A0A919WFR7_9BACI|nr:hypothetical protein [Robertmurraya siralis]GIN60901.1 hypothetical protein J27TS8_08940 [Robertmurraya siralis]